MKDWDRREFLKLLASLPTAILIGCETGRQKASVEAPTLSPEESLRRLIHVLGPWSGSEKAQAEEFAGRFLKAEHTLKHYLPESNEVVQSLATRFPEGTTAAKEIRLEGLPTEERELLFELVKQLYSLTEMRSIVSKEPPLGQCLGDNTWHTRPRK